MKKTTQWSSVKAEILKDPEVKKEFDVLSSEFELIEQIIHLRLMKQLSQKELAQRMGTTQSAIARVESGRSNPTLRFMERLADALGVQLTVRLG